MAARTLRLVPRQTTAPQPKPGRWGQLAAPVDPMDTTHIARALSIVHGMARPGGWITPEQAREVIAWAEPAPQRKRPWWRRLI